MSRNGMVQALLSPVPFADIDDSKCHVGRKKYDSGEAWKCKKSPGDECELCTCTCTGGRVSKVCKEEEECQTDLFCFYKGYFYKDKSEIPYCYDKRDCNRCDRCICKKGKIIRSGCGNQDEICDRE